MVVDFYFFNFIVVNGCSIIHLPHSPQVRGSLWQTAAVVDGWWLLAKVWSQPSNQRSLTPAIFTDPAFVSTTRPPYLGSLWNRNTHASRSGTSFNDRDDRGSLLTDKLEGFVLRSIVGLWHLRLGI